MKHLVRLVALALFIAIVAMTPPMVRSALTLQQNKADMGELNHIYYGLFNINEWKGQIALILYAEINRLDIKTTIKDLKGTVEGQLTVIIDKLNERIKEANRESFGGKIKQLLINLVVDIEDVKKGVPGYADALIKEITKPETEKQVKSLATKQMKAYFAKTFEKQKTAHRDQILVRNGETDIEVAKINIAKKVEIGTAQVRNQMMILISLSILLFAIVGLSRVRSRLNFVLMTLTLLVLMIIGVSTPMIDLDAKISEMSFFLLGHKIEFTNQVLYFQSKSVIDVFKIMITHQDILMKFVGILMIGFSVIIPCIKLLSSLAYYFDVRSSRKSRLINFFVFKSGKWSMADVMVVAIFMAYIGFSGIVTNQFGKIQSLVPSEIVFISTNGTSLQPGFFAFLTYVLLALVLSSMLAKLNRPNDSKSDR